MTTINEIASVTVTSSTKVPTRVGFGTPLFLCHALPWPQRLKTIFELQDLIDAGLTAEHPAYRKCAKAFAQNPRPAKAIIGKRTRPMTQIVNIIPRNVQAGYVYEFSYVSPTGVVTDVAVTNDGTPTVAEAVTAITAALSAITGAAAVAVGATHVQVTAAVAGVFFNLRNLPAVDDMALLDVSTDGGVVADITDCLTAEDEANSFYAVSLDTVASSEIEAAAGAILPLAKLFFYNTSDWDCADADEDDDIMSTLQAATNKRAIGLFQQAELLGYSVDAWIGAKLPIDPGKTTWDAVELAGVTKDALKNDQDLAIKGKNGNTYTDVAALGYTFKGLAASGTWIDETHGLDALTRRLKEAVLAVKSNLSNSGLKLPYTQDGATALQNAVNAVLESFSPDPGLLIPAGKPRGWSTQAPNVDLASAGDKNNRILPPITFQAYFQGGINQAQITGNVSV